MSERTGGAVARAAAAWVAWVLRRPRAVVAAALACCLALGPLVATRLGLNSNEDALFAEEADYVAAREEFRRAFPGLIDPVVVVLDATTVDAAEQATARLASRLRREPQVFPGVFEPEGGRFFEAHGLLYLETAELEDVLGRLVEAQPYLGALGADPSLRGLADVLGDAAEATATGALERFELVSVLGAVGGVVRSQLSGSPRALSWAELLLGEGFAEDVGRRRVLLVQPVVDYGALQPAAATLDGLRRAVGELGLDADSHVRVRLTGLFALSAEEAQLVSAQAAWAGLGSFALVACVLLLGLGSARVALALLATLTAGLLFTAAFAALAVGHLNLLSVAFAVLFIGLSVDFGIHLSVAAREHRARGASPERALVLAAGDVGGSLAVCAATTAIGFYAFLFTDFLGVAELGLIAGTGMLVSLAANLTLLPALLALLASERGPRSSPAAHRAWLGFPLRHPRAVVAAASLLACGAALLVPAVHFDENPLRVRDPSAQSVQAFWDLLADGRALPWNVSVLAESRAKARELSQRLEALPSVDQALWLEDYVPSEQPEKLAAIEDAAFLLLPSLERSPAPPPSAEERRRAVVELSQALGPLATAPDGGLAAAATRLRDSLDRWLAGPGARAEAPAWDELERSLLGSLPGRLQSLRRALQPGAVTADALPADLRALLVSGDGRLRIEVFPSENLDDNAALERYVRDVQATAPGSFGEGIAIYEIGRTVVGAFRQALATAAVLIGVVLLLVWRSARDALLAAAPIALAALLTAAATAALSMPLNFANVIVIPLLLGMGVDTGIHLVHRLRSGPLPGGNLLETGTARAVLLSALTTVASFGTLGFSTHLGMASLGRLLALGIALILASNLVLLPALVALVDRPRGVDPERK